MKYAVTAAMLLILFIFIRTAPPTIYMGDSGEIVSAAYTLGIGHPPGYPAYVLCAKLFTGLPAGDIAYRVNIFSAFLSSLAFLLFVLVSRELILIISGGKAVKNDRRAASMLAAGMLVFSGAFWFQGINAKGGIYIFTVVIMLLSALSALLHFRTGKKSFFYLTFYSAGFMVPAHPSAALLSFFIPAAVMIYAAMKKDMKPAQAAAAACLFLAGFITPYAYLFIRAGAGPLVNWRGLAGAGDVMNHIMRKAYEHTGEPPQNTVLFFRMGKYMAQLLTTYGILLAFFIYGMYMLFRAKKRFFFTAAALIAANTAALVYAVQTQAGFTGIAQLPMSIHLSRGFYLINEVFPALISALGIYGVIRLAEKKLQGAGPYTAIFLTAASVVFLFINFRANDHSKKFHGYDHAMNIMKTLEKGDRLFSSNDCPSFNIVYLKDVKKFYPDIKVYDRNLNLLDKSVYYEVPGPRIDTEIRYINEYPGRVFFTESFINGKEGITSRPRGVLHEPVKAAKAKAGAGGYFSMYTIRDYYRNKNLDFFYSDQISKYLTAMAAHAAMEGDIEAAKRRLSMADSMGGGSVLTLIDIVNVSFSALRDNETTIFYLKKLCEVNPFDTETLDLLMDLYVNYDEREALAWAKKHYPKIPGVKGRLNVKIKIDALQYDVNRM